MKLTKNTIEILNNFRGINENLVVYPGNRIRTRSEDNRVFAEATVEETFDREFGLYDLKSFISAYNILKDPELVFSDEDYVLIKEGRSEIKYFFSSTSFLTAIPPDRELLLKSKDVCFHLTQALMDKISKMSLFDSDRKHWIVEFKGEDGEIYLNVYHKDDPTMTSYTTVVGKTTDAFCIQTFLDSFVLMSGDYEVVLSKNPFLLEATNTSRNLRYVLPMSPDSTFEG
jgi:hypothetical protein